MKKIFILALMISLIICFTACQTESTLPENDEQSIDTSLETESESVTCTTSETESEISVEILSELGIIDKDKITSDEYITVYDALVAIDKARGCYSEEITSLSDWYKGHTLASLDHLDDSVKALLLSLYTKGSNSVLSYEEIADLKLDNHITNYEVLIYILRMIGDTSSCVDDTISNVDTEIISVYSLAHEKGLISYEGTDNSGLPMTYKDFCQILYGRNNVNNSTAVIIKGNIVIILNKIAIKLTPIKS